MAYSTIIFDLDDTLYPPSSHVWDLISDRIHTYMIDRIGLNPAEVVDIRQQYYQTYGTTLRGLIIHHHIEPKEYLDFVHDIPIAEKLLPNLPLQKMLKSLPQHKMIFTNSDQSHAQRVLEFLGIADHFEKIISIMDIYPYCKPMKEAFDIALQMMAVNASDCVFIDDSLKNLDQAKSQGLFTVLPNASEIDPDSRHATIIDITDLPKVLPI